MTTSPGSHEGEPGRPSEAEAKTEAEGEPDSPEDEAKSESETEAKAKTEAKTGAEGKPDSPEEEHEPEAEARDEAETEAKAKTEAEGEPDSPGEEAETPDAHPLVAHPLIGHPSPPPPALTVAISERFVAMVRSARRRQWTVNTLGISGVVVGAVALAIAVESYTGRGRVTALAEAFVGGGLLVAGSVLKRRPLELGAGVCARGTEGRIALRTSLLGVFLFISSLFREAAEGAVYGLGVVQSDPATELAAWLVLALSKPHGPGPGVWASLGGVNAAGLFGFPEDLKVALSALRARGWIEVDSGRYPPLARLPEGEGDLLTELMR